MAHKVLETWSGSALASALGSVVFSERRMTNPGNLPLFVFVQVSIAGVSGGDATSDIVLQVLNNLTDANGGTQLQVKEVGATAPNVTVDVVSNTAAPADATKLYFAISIPAASATAAYPVPIVGWVGVRLSNPAVAYTAGTVSWTVSLVAEV